ncbi:MAG: disulfide oxidoreductase [Chloroflexota bacterium]
MPASLVQTLFAIAAIAGVLFLIWAVVMAIAARFSDEVADTVDRLRHRFAPWAPAAAFTVAAIATFGSLYFSEVVGYEPCRLCWYQRIAMYPLVVILAVAVARRDVGVRWYALPVALIGAGISTYHYFLEWFPQIDTGACHVGIPCTAVWFREFGFVSLPFLALTAFLLIIAFLVIPPRGWRHPRSAAIPDDLDTSATA